VGRVGRGTHVDCVFVYSLSPPVDESPPTDFDHTPLPFCLLPLPYPRGLPRDSPEGRSGFPKREFESPGFSVNRKVLDSAREQCRFRYQQREPRSQLSGRYA